MVSHYCDIEINFRACIPLESVGTSSAIVNLHMLTQFRGYRHRGTFTNNF